MTIAAAPSSPAGSDSSSAHGDPHPAAPQRLTGGDACPLCGTPLSPEQDWCLRCGAAARTRLAATPNWRAPIAAIAVVAVLALVVLAAALVKLAGGSGSSAAPATMTVTTPAASTPATPTSTVPGATTVPGASTPTAPTASPPGATIPPAPRTTAPNAGAAATSGALGKAFPGLTPAQREALRKFNKRAAGR